MGRSHQGTLTFTRAEVVAGVRFILFLVSLALPAYKHGRISICLEGFTVGTLLLLRPVFDELHRICIWSFAMHLAAIIAWVCVFNRWTVSITVKAVLMTTIVLSGLRVLAAPYSSVETVYFGYYLWVFGVVVIGSALFISVETQPEIRPQDSN